MWFKNLQIFRLAPELAIDPDAFADRLAPNAFQPGSGLDPVRHGWVAPVDGGALVHTVGSQLLLSMRTEKKLLPASVVNQVARERARDMEAEQGYKPGRKQMRELKERVTDELLPRAFAVWRDTRVWLDPLNQWLVIDTAASAGCDEAIKLLTEADPKLGIRPWNTRTSPASAMTGWLVEGEAPSPFTIDQDAELRSVTQSKATVRYAREALDAEDVRRHIESGKQCTRLAMSWADRVSFVLTEGLSLKRIAPLDILAEQRDDNGNAAEQFDGDFTLMTAELAQLLAALEEALGGAQQEGGAPAPAVAPGSAPVRAAASTPAATRPAAAPAAGANSVPPWEDA